MLTFRNRIFAIYWPESIFHILLWTFVIAERWLNHYTKTDNALWYGLYQTVFLLATFIVPVYIHAFVLIPLYLRKFKWVQYSALLVIMILCVNMARGLLAIFYFQLSNNEYDLFTDFFKWAFMDYASFDRFIFGPTAWILWLAFAYRFIKDWFWHEYIQARLTAEKNAMELAFLKSQVDPHFLFNTLNNLYALALDENAQRTADGVAKMGTLMRYSLHDSQSERILLHKEIDYIEKYIELQKLRIVEGTDVNIHMELELNEVRNEQIAPMILMPFIENAFKYGISTVHPSSVSIKLTLAGGILALKVENTIHGKVQESQGGIGLNNVQNRLRLIYPERHKLECIKNNTMYQVSLEINVTE